MSGRFLVIILLVLCCFSLHITANDDKENGAEREQSKFVKKLLTPKNIYSINDLPLYTNQLLELSRLTEKEAKKKDNNSSHYMKDWETLCKNMKGKYFVGYGIVQEAEAKYEADIKVLFPLFRYSSKRKRYGMLLNFDLTGNNKNLLKGVASGKTDKVKYKKVINVGGSKKSRKSKKKKFPQIKPSTHFSFVCKITDIEIGQSKERFLYIMSYPDNPDDDEKFKYYPDFEIRIKGDILSKRFKWNNEEYDKDNFLRESMFPSIESWLKYMNDKYN